MNQQNNQEFVTRFEEVCEKFADKAAITYLRNDDSKLDFTFKNIFGRIQAAVELFARAGLQPGDRAAIISPLSPHAVFALFSLVYANITAVLIDSTLPPQEIDKLIEFSDLRAIFTVPAIYETINKQRTNDIPVFDLSNESMEMGRQVFDGSADKVSRPQTADPDISVFALLFSSGTTSEMKGVELNYFAAMKTVDIVWKVAAVNERTYFMHVLPINHIAGLMAVITFFLAGSNIGMVEDLDATKLQKGLLAFNPTHFLVVPKVYEVMEYKIRQEVKNKGAVVEKIFYMLHSLCGFLYKNFNINLGKLLFGSIRKMVFGKRLFALGTGGSLCNKKTAEFYLNMGISLWANFYASTETNIPASAVGTSDRYPAGTEGNIKRFEGIDVKIHEPDENGVGEIRIKTVLIMKGYFRDPELTGSAFDENGYFKTGDLGYIDKKGYLHITGRAKEAIHMHTGKKVAPTDVDNLYGGLCPNVTLASCGVPCKDGNYDEIHIFIESGNLLADVQQIIKKTIMDFSSKTSTLYKISKVHFIDKIVLTSVGKVKRYLLKEAAIAERTSEAEIEISVSLPQQEAGANAEDIVCRVISRHTNGQTVTPDSNLKYDLNIDSLRMMEICVEIEGALNILIAESMGAVETVRDIINLIEAQDSGGGKKRGVDYNIEDYPLKKTRLNMMNLRRYLWYARFFWKCEIAGIENVPLDKNYILCSNHQSNLDGLWIWAAIGEKRADLTKICCLAKHELLQKTISRTALTWLGGIPVDRSGNSVPAMKRCLACLKDGYNVLIHPEGTRTHDGKMQEFKGGAAMLAIDANAPVIPVRIDGAWDIFPPSRKLPKTFRFGRRYPVRVAFGEPISPAGKGVEELTSEIYDAVVKLEK